MGKFLRHGAGALAGAALGSVVAWLRSKGIEVDPETISLVQSSMTNGLVLFVTILGYAGTEKILKRFPSIDREGWIDRLWLKSEAENPSTDTRALQRRAQD